MWWTRARGVVRIMWAGGGVGRRGEGVWMRVSSILPLRTLDGQKGAEMDSAHDRVMGL